MGGGGGRLGGLVRAAAAGGIGFGRAAAMDMLLTTTLGAALAMLAWWLWEEKAAALYGFYALLGVATLSKGPLAVALAGMVALGYVANFRQWKKIPKLLWTPALGCFAIIAAVWYWLCYQANGYAFVEEFFIRHNVQRLTSAAAIGHPEPFWFYVPILAAALFPWTPLLALPLLELSRPGLL